MALEFEWDENKNQSNIRKHGISFELAKTIFEYPTLTWIDARKEYGETREVSIGRTEDIIVIVVVHTDRNDKTRIISARPASKHERSRYNAFTQQGKDH